MSSQRIFKYPLFSPSQFFLAEAATEPQFVFPIFTPLLWTGPKNLREYQNSLNSPNLRTTWHIDNVFLSFTSIEFSQSAAVVESEWQLEFIVEVSNQPAYVYILEFTTPTLPENILNPVIVITKNRSIILEAYTATEVSRAASVVFTCRLKGPEGKGGGLNKSALISVKKPKLELVVDQEYEPSNFSRSGGSERITT